MRLANSLPIFILMFFLMACSSQIKTNMPKEIQDFEFITQNEATLSLEELQGKWWIAYFMYTNCTLVCPNMTANMVKFQEMLRDEDLDVRIVSFSVDPDYDTPKVLREYAEEYGANLSNWDFLTGYDFETIKDLSIHSFNTMLQEGSSENENKLITHSTDFFLINPRGEIVKTYDGTGPQQIEEIIEDLKKNL